MTATTALRNEHERILSVIACLRVACDAARSEDGFDAETFRQGLDFIRNYADGWHHAKEEVHLFPALEAAGVPRDGGPVGVMLQEHEIGRSHVGVMTEHLESAADGDGPARVAVLEHALAYADLLEAHIRKEDNILFNMADRILPPEEHERLEAAYRTAVPDGADSDTGARYEELARALCERWQIDPDEVRSLQGGCG
jgi:hemerythrin-like domain-containing protein